jgi:UDPglucose 6-dehydrogenase
MNITVIGSGYVGLVSGSCFAEMGNRVTCVDIDQDKIQKLEEGILPIFEPGLEQLVRRNVKNKDLFFTTSIGEAISDSEIIFIAVGTPMGEDGSADLQYVLAAAKSIGQTMQKSSLLLINLQFLLERQIK